MNAGPSPDFTGEERGGGEGAVTREPNEGAKVGEAQRQSRASDGRKGEQRQDADEGVQAGLLQVSTGTTGGEKLNNLGLVFLEQ